ncbi:hypothetical protein GGS23DRAFT_592906 [Durotheca rogersii]|uniref:uncharacterized protein n=1 Tax=Durotheca rogersii TaxID=419775 RepID=UPI00221EA7B9|nr:uncharacterized protein GGS23DRAFT_592906 [Durotheca rogersii]KAI5867603.1 hypothetical protein GGS23DRAFT_592906 [Durotheca rogersii]
MDDEDGDVIMPDAPPLEPGTIHTPPPAPQSAPTIIKVPIRRREKKMVLSFIPYDNPAVLSVVPWRWHRNLGGIFWFRYTDFRGWPALQPTANIPRIREYFGALDDNDERAGCDPLLLEARRWCCSVQGFCVLEPELRWLMTLIFDLVNFAVERQRTARNLAQHSCRDDGKSTGNSPEEDLDPEKVLWEGRYYLYFLIMAAKVLKREFKVEGLTIPSLPWFSI